MKPDGIGGLQVRRLTALDAAVLALLQATNVCVVSTLAPDGVVRARAVWVDTDGEHVVLNSTPRRRWVSDLERDGRVTCTVVNLENPYEFVSIEGRQVERATAGADQHIDAMASKYLGLDGVPVPRPEPAPDHHPHPPRPRDARAPRGRPPRLSPVRPNLVTHVLDIENLGDQMGR